MLRLRLSRVTEWFVSRKFARAFSASTKVLYARVWSSNSMIARFGWYTKLTKKIYIMLSFLFSFFSFVSLFFIFSLSFIYLYLSLFICSLCFHYILYLFFIFIYLYLSVYCVFHYISFIFSLSFCLLSSLFPYYEK